MKIVALGVNSKTGKCCIIKSNATYDMLKENYDLYKVEYDSTNWSGRDDVERTLELRKIKLTDKSFNHKETVSGTDYDHGHDYPWTFKFDIVYEVEEVKDYDDGIFSLF